MPCDALHHKGKGQVQRYEQGDEAEVLPATPRRAEMQHQVISPQRGVHVHQVYMPKLGYKVFQQGLRNSVLAHVKGQEHGQLASL